MNPERRGRPEPAWRPAIREVSDADSDDVWRVLVEVFAGEQGIPAAWNGVSAERKPQWWCAELDDAVVGVAAAWSEAGQVHWGRYAVRREFRGLRIGTELARHSFDCLFSQGVDQIHIDARDTTVRIIRGMGGSVVGPAVSFFGTVIPMVLTRADYRLGTTDDGGADELLDSDGPRGGHPYRPGHSARGRRSTAGTDDEGRPDDQHSQ